MRALNAFYSLLFALAVTFNQFVEVGGLEGQASISQRGLVTMLFLQLKFSLKLIILGLVQSTIFILIFSAMLHGCLKMLAGANKTFEATFRTVAYFNYKVPSVLSWPCPLLVGSPKGHRRSTSCWGWPTRMKPRWGESFLLCSFPRCYLLSCFRCVSWPRLLLCNCDRRVGYTELKFLS